MRKKLTERDKKRPGEREIEFKKYTRGVVEPASNESDSGKIQFATQWGWGAAMERRSMLNNRGPEIIS